MREKLTLFQFEDFLEERALQWLGCFAFLSFRLNPNFCLLVFIINATKVGLPTLNDLIKKKLTGVTDCLVSSEFQMQSSLAIKNIHHRHIYEYPPQTHTHIYKHHNLTNQCIYHSHIVAFLYNVFLNFYSILNGVTILVYNNIILASEVHKYLSNYMCDIHL